jgi:hypothetical protein
MVMFFTNIKIAYDVRPYVRNLGLTKPTVQKFNKDKIYVDILLSNDNLLSEICEAVGDAFHCIIQYIGPEKEASQFKYKFVLEGWGRRNNCVQCCQ